jgi:hypothetical protein
MTDLSNIQLIPLMERVKNGQHGARFFLGKLRIPQADDNMDLKEGNNLLNPAEIN